MDLYDNYEGYDEENPDLEQEMYMRDIAEENDESIDGEEESSDSSSSEALDEETEDSSNVEGSDAVKSKHKMRSKNVKITDAYLAKQLAINIETYRDNVKFKYDGVVYIGKVIRKLRENEYVFNAVEDGGDIADMKLKKFLLSKIRRVEK